MAQFGLYSDFKMKPQEMDSVDNLPEWTRILQVMIKFRQADLAITKPALNSGTNSRRIDRCTRISWKSIEELTSFQVSICTAASTNRNDLDNAVGLLDRTQRQGYAL